MSWEPENMQKVVISGSNNVLYVNPNDKRSRWIIRDNGVTQPRVTQIWRKIVSTWHPTFVLDVGVNYGEIIFSTQYDPKMHVIGIEANALLLPYIYKALEEHPNHKQINIIHALAGETSGEEHTFYVDRGWSGSSSAVPMLNHSMIEKTTVTSIAIDSLFSDLALSEQRILFKLDVEGYEEFVMKGMSAIRSECEHQIGYIEFNDKWLEKAGTDPMHFLKFLQENYHVFIHYSSSLLLHFKDLQLEKIKRYYRNHTDLLLVTDLKTVQQLGIRVKWLI